MPTKLFLATFLFLVPLVSCQIDLDTLYDQMINVVINYNGVREKVRTSLANVEDGNLIALQMFDASSKIPSGLAVGSLYDLGHFDACYNIEAGDIFGKYCLGSVSLNSLPLLQNTSVREGIEIEMASSFSFYVAVCIPNNWSVSEIPGFVSYSEDRCYSKPSKPDLTTGAIVMVVVLSLFAAVIVASTLFDVYLHSVEKESPHELLLAFSFWTNGRKIFAATTNPDQLLCLNGIKAISMMWIVIGHDYSNAMSGPISNYLALQDFQNDPGNMFVMGATIAVDTFLVVGGLVTVYVFLKSMDRGAKFNIVLYYVHRYLRLTPVFLIIILINMYLIQYLGTGPLWNNVARLSSRCEEAWWSNILYISNYLNYGNCVPPTWYLSVDMQLFILSPLILFPLLKRPRIGVAALGFLIVAGCVVPFALSFAKKLGMLSVGEQSNFTEFYYKQPYTRFGPYVIGMLLGYFLYKIKKNEMKIRLKPLLVISAWILCLAIMVVCLYAGHPLYVSTEEDRWGNALFIAFEKPAWSMALCGIIFLCVTGYGGPIDTLLSLPILQFLAKISYCTYLLHYPLIFLKYAGMKNNFKFSNPAIMHVFWGDFVLTCALSVIFCLAFESPVIILEKHLFGRGKTKGGEKRPKV